MGSRSASSRCHGVPSRQEAEGVARRNGPAEEMPLALLASLLEEHLPLRVVADAIGGDRQSKPTAKARQGAHNCRGFGFEAHIFNEAAVNLHLVELEIA